MALVSVTPDESATDNDGPLTVIERRRGWALLGLGELWRYRELLFFLAWRDLKVRYKQTVLGALWAILQPLSFVAAFALFFGRLSDTAPGGLPYPLFVLAGLLPWNFFAASVSAASQSVVGNQNLVTKVYFPRLVIPASAAGAPLFDLSLCLALLTPVLLAHGVLFTPALLLLPVVILGLIATAVGVGAFLAALTVAYRDFRYVVPWMLQLGMFLTPAIYLQAGDNLAPWLRSLLPLNPMQGLATGFRGCLTGEGLHVPGVLLSCGYGLTILAAGCLYFRRVERSFADVI